MRVHTGLDDILNNVDCLMALSIIFGFMQKVKRDGRAEK